MKPKAVQNSKETKTKAPAVKVSGPKPAQKPVPAQRSPAPAAHAEATVAAPAKAQPKETTTAVAAKVDVGFGNALFIRGEGDGLSWDKGTPLQCVDGSTWVWSTKRAKGKVVFKLLVNDQVWSQGQDLVVEAGKQAEVVPVF